MVLGSKGIYFQLSNTNTHSRYVKPVGGSQTTPYFSVDLGVETNFTHQRRQDSFRPAKWYTGGKTVVGTVDGWNPAPVGR